MNLIADKRTKAGNDKGGRENRNGKQKKMINR
jgi:hypothetical protein